MTADAFFNAIAVDMAIGGSTNTVLHLLAIAKEAGIGLKLEDFDAMSRSTPKLCSFRPGGSFYNNTEKDAFIRMRLFDSQILFYQAVYEI